MTVPTAALTLLLSACVAAGRDEPEIQRPTGDSAQLTTSAIASPTATPTPEPLAELPRGGRRIFPSHRLVGFSGGRGASFGRLGVGDIDKRAAEIEKLAAQYTPDGRTPLPIFELIAVVAHRSPTRTGLYRTHEPSEVVDTFLEAVRRHRGLLLLNIQPGRADFIDDVKTFENWLLEPDVGLALDAEWAVDAGEVPGEVIGSTTGAELDSVAVYLSSLVRAHDLPEKVMVYHQFHTATVIDEEQLRPHPGVVLVKSIDGVGVPADKVATWNRLARELSPHVYTGFKLFFEEDTRRGALMTPAEVLALRPQPSYVLYE
ncbi:MAG TPA: hypothetical protein VIQ02_06525 [Jiangellaceae bacterium]